MKYPDYLLTALALGTGATAFLDVIALARTRFGAAPPDYRLIGRWLVRMAGGRFRPVPIAAIPPARGELAIGWSAHYLTGILFAAILLAIVGLDWAGHPTILPALLAGVASVAAPFLLMQPLMGAGIAARRTPRPGAARLRSLTTHLVFGIGLYAAACIVATLTR